MKLVAGSYERFLWGWKVKVKPASLECAFSYPAHMGPVRCIAGCGSVIATGGSDDTIRVFDINTMSDKGSLVKHEGAISCLAFYGTAMSDRMHPTHLVSGSEDGRICIWDTDAWIHLKTLTGGKKTAINDLAVHPSGRIALSVDHDAHLRMWNLMKGRCSFSVKVASEASLIQYAAVEGKLYSVARDCTVEICNAEDGQITETLQHTKRVLCKRWHKGTFLVTGGENCSVDAWDVRTPKVAFSISKAHTRRIKGIAFLDGSQHAQEEDFPRFIASGSSDGVIRVWDTRMVTVGDTSKPLIESATKSRLTCLISCGSLRKKVISRANSTEDAAAASVGGLQREQQISSRSVGNIDGKGKGVGDVGRLHGKRRKTHEGSFIRNISRVLKSSPTRTMKAGKDLA